MVMIETEEYDFNESIALADALQKKAERCAEKQHLPIEEVKKSGIKKYNEVRRKHAIEFIKKYQEKINSLSNQTIANLLRALIALGLTIEDEEELGYWINLLASEALLRLNDYVNQVSAGYWDKKQKNKQYKENYSGADIAELDGIVKLLREINVSVNKSDAAKKRIDEFLDKIEKTLWRQNSKYTGTRKGQNYRRERAEAPEQEDAFEILKDKMTASGIEQGGRYWTDVVSDFEASSNKNEFARTWGVDVNKKNEEDIQRINELRGVDIDIQRRQEQEEIQKQIEREAQIRQDEQNNQLKREQEKINNVENMSKKQIEQEFENSNIPKENYNHMDKRQKNKEKNWNNENMMKMKSMENQGR